MAQEALAYIGLGSNLGDRAATLKRALQLLDQAPGVRVVRQSAWMETTALSDNTHPAYLNGVAEVTTTLIPLGLYQVMAGIEDQLGRERPTTWAPRTLDLDLLLFGDQVIDSPELTVPHPQMLLRHFVLEPLAELVPECRYPGLDTTLSQLVERLHHTSYLYRPDQPQLIAIAGNMGVGKTTLAERLSVRLAGEVLYEPYASNPFMPRVYAGQQDLALDSQLYFLANRLDQLSPEQLTPGACYLADYVFDKEQIYARLLVDPDQYALYQRLYRSLAQQVTRPVLVLYLRDSVRGCLDRIRQRGRDYEQAIETEFLEFLDREYEACFSNWQQCPVLRLNVLAFDCLSDDHLDKLVQELRPYLNKRPMSEEPHYASR